MTTSLDPPKIKVEKKETVSVPKIIYLGQLISLENRVENEVNQRINLAWKKFWLPRHIFKGKFQNYRKGEIFNMFVAPVLTYRSPTWSLTSGL